MKEYIRLLNEDDYLLYKKIRLELLENHPWNFGSSYQEECAFEDLVWKRRLSKNTVDTYGMFDDGNIMGVAVVVYNPRMKMKHNATINSMYINKEYRRQGHASSLMNQIISDAADKKIYRLNLSVVESNINAIKLYKSKGFIQYGLEPDTICINGKFHSLKLMSLKLQD